MDTRRVKQRLKKADNANTYLAFKGTYVGIISVAGDDQDGWIFTWMVNMTTVSHSSEAVDPYPVWDDAISS